VRTAHRDGGAHRLADGLDVLAVHRDEDVDDDRCARQVHRVIAVARARHEPRGRVVEDVVARVARSGQDRPHRQQRLCDEDRLGGDDHRVGQQVAPVRGIQQEPRVGQDADRPDQHQQHHDGTRTP